MKKLLVANWKLNPDTEKEAVALARAENAKNVVICPPFPFLSAVSKVLTVGGRRSRAALGAQDVFWESSGAYTGEVSLPELKDLGVEYIIIGHSERRALGETDGQVNKKVRVALSEGFKVILCVGESAEVRKRGLAVAKKFVVAQLKKDLKSIRHPKSVVRNLIVAYEPLWAIGSGMPDTPKEAAAMARFIKSEVRGCRVLYGGSVNSMNTQAFLAHKEIDGALVGGASVRTPEFKKMIALNK